MANDSMIKLLQGRRICRIPALAAVFLMLALSAFLMSPQHVHADDTGQDDIARPQPPAADDGRLDLIRKRGRLVVGVKADYPPWGMIDENGELVGMEADLAADIAAALGVELDLTAVTTSNRLRKLEDGSIDLVIATMGDTPKRRQISGLLQPHYYASGVDLLTPKDTPFTSWGQLRGRSVCVTAGAYYNRTIIDRYLIDPVTFKGTRDTQLGLRDGQCVGWAYDNTSLARLVTKPEWSNYNRPLPTILSTPWALAVRKTEQNAAWGRFVSDMIAYWHRSGFILDVESKWGLPESTFLREQHEIWSEKDDNGGYVCQRGEDGQFPASCLDQSLADTLAGADAQSGFASFLKANLGLDIGPLYNSYDRQRLLSGVGTTLLLSLSAIIGSVTAGILLALLKRKGGWIVRAPVNGLISLARMTPPILQLYILFFGLGGVLASGYGLTINGFLVATVVLSLYAGASNAVIISAALDHLEEEGIRGGLRRMLPLSIERAYEGLVANSVNIVKAAGLASTIAVPEMISATNGIITENGNAAAMMNILLIFYFVFVLVVLGLLKSAKGLVSKWTH